MAIQENIQGDLERMSASVQGESIPVPQVTQADAELVDQDLAAVAGLQTEEMPEFEPVAGLGTLVTKAAKKVLPKKAAEAVETVVEQTAPNFIKRVKKATAEAEERSVLIEQPQPRVSGPTITIMPEDEAGMSSFITALGAQKGKGINLVRIIDEVSGETRDSLEYLNAVKNANKDLIESARRGTLNMDSLVAAAEARGMDDVVRQFLKRKEGEVFNAEDFVAGFIATVSLNNEARALGKKALQSGAKADKDAWMKVVSAEAEMLASVSGVASESAGPCMR